VSVDLTAGGAGLGAGLGGGGGTAVAGLATTGLSAAGCAVWTGVGGGDASGSGVHAPCVSRTLWTISASAASVAARSLRGRSAEGGDPAALAFSSASLALSARIASSSSFGSRRTVRS